LYLTNFISLRRADIVMFWGWSLALEEQFYLTVPLLFVLLTRLRSDRARLGLLLLMWLTALAVRLYIYLRYAPWTDLALYSALYFRTHTRFDTLVAGIILALVHQRFKGPIAQWLTHPFHRALLALPSLACLWLLLRPWLFGQQHVQIVHVFAWGTITSLMYFGFLLLLLYGDGFIQRFLGAPLFRRVATLGYGVYLIHIPVIDRILVPAAHALEARHVSMLLVWPASLATVLLGSWGVGYLMHIFIEKPSLRIREKLAG
jgi:peptidoglycan/LPS O-acetylase OafA/YrhL